MTQTIRAAAAQFHVGNDVAQNLATCVRMMRNSAQHTPDLMVLPEFSNHCSWYDGPEHCYEVSVDLDGEFLGAIADEARALKAHVVINCTVRRDGNKVTGTSVMFGPDGSVLGTTDKQVLIGHENDFLERSTEAGPVIDTPLGRLAMYSCMDGVINETPRCLALRGAQVLCNSLNSFAIDEGNLHIPVRAAENKVWVVAANKVGPLIPAELVGPVSEATAIPAHFLDGAGDSQIVAPDGRVLAMAGKDEEVVSANIDVALADDKTRPDGTDIFASRRSQIYRPLGEDPATQTLPELVGADDVAAASITLRERGDAAVEEAIRKITAAEAAGAKLICLPALAGTCGLEHFDLAVEAISRAISGDTVVATTIVDDGAHVAVAIDAGGIALRQGAFHASNRRGDAAADSVETLSTPHGTVGVLQGDDAIYPEILRLFAFAGVNILLVPADFAESWESGTGLTERSAENRINVIAASHADSAGDSLILSLQKDFTIMTPWQDREFDGLLSAPEIFRAENDVLVAEIHPLAAANKECSRKTHLVASRPWDLLDPMLA